MKHLGLLALMIFLIIFNGLVISQLWAWIIVPTFALAPLTIPQAIGLDILITFLVASSSTKKSPTFEETLLALIDAFFKGITFLAMGFVVALFI